MQAVGLEGTELNTEDLVGKKLSVEVSERTYPDPDSGAEKTITEAGHFEMVEEADTSEAYRQLKYAVSSPYLLLKIPALYLY